MDGARTLAGYHDMLAETRLVVVVAGSAFDPRRRRANDVLAQLEQG